MTVRNSHTEHDQENSKLHKNSISCFYVSARSIVNKLDELALCIDETWLTEDISNNEVGFEGYTIFRKDRNSRVKSRRGVM